MMTQGFTEGAGFFAPIDAQMEFASLPAPKYPNLQVERTRHGRVVNYYRRGKAGRVRLPDDVGSPEFIRAYDDAPRRIAEIRADRLSKSVMPVANVMIPTLRGAATRARMRGMDYDLTERWVIEKLEEQNGRCALTGLPFSLAKAGMRGRDPFGPSLDRIDCKKGYTPANTRIILLALNIMLTDWGEDVFQTVIAAYTSRPAP